MPMVVTYKGQNLLPMGQRLRTACTCRWTVILVNICVSGFALCSSKYHAVRPLVHIISCYVS